MNMLHSSGYKILNEKWLSWDKKIQILSMFFESKNNHNIVVEINDRHGRVRKLYDGYKYSKAHVSYLSNISNITIGGKIKNWWFRL